MAVETVEAPLTLGDRMKAAPWEPTTTIIRVLEHTFAFLALTQPIKPVYWPVMIGMYLWMCMSTGMYLHRIVSHRCLECAAPLRFFLTIGTALNLGGDPIRWAAVHRWHHVHSDTPNDVHTPVHGFIYAQGFWAHKLDAVMLEPMLNLVKDQHDYWLHRWFYNPNIYVIPHLLAVAIFYGLWGWGGVAWCLYVPLVVLIHVTHAVNSFGHMPRFGSRRYETRDTSTNVWWLALPTLGDAWHNNHHAHPGKAGHGEAWYEIDINKGLIWLFEKVGLVRKVVW
jgi:stearoyl-CoA desaturase (delta-9 desaturase)